MKRLEYLKITGNFASVVMLMVMSVFISSKLQAGSNRDIPTVIKYDSIIIQKSKVSKRCTISMYPNASHEVLFFSAAGREGKVFDLFIFNMEGKLMKRIQVRNRETTLLKTFEKGNYFFEVFSNDERIENGNMTIN